MFDWKGWEEISEVQEYVLFYVIYKQNPTSVGTQWNMPWLSNGLSNFVFLLTTHVVDAAE